MHCLFPTQRPTANALGHHHAGARGQGGPAQPAEAPGARSLSPEARRSARRMGYSCESPRRCRDRSLSDSGAGVTAIVSQPVPARAFSEGKSAMRSVAQGIIRFYQACLSPALPSSCRYFPSCSEYAHEAVERWGVWRGAWLTLRRVVRCRPWGGHGYDPVP
jgi:putative membrane protein insertion efficiency factor